jgi:hypothetical protein
MRRLKTLLCHTLAFALAFGPAVAYAEGSAVTSILQGTKSALDTGNQLATTMAASAAQMQQMVNAFSTLQNQQGTAATAQSALDQVKTDLSSALSSAAVCVSEAETKKNSDIARYKKANIATATQLVNAEPTCANYGIIVDSGRKLADQLAAAKKKGACLKQLQNSLNQIADKSKSAFSNLTTAANEVWNTQEQIIQNHKTISDRIDKDLNGENGYQAKLANLKKLSSALYQQINAGAGKDGGGGIASRLRSAKAGRNQAANSWYKSMMGEVQSCFSSSPTTCNSGTANSALGCIADALGQNNAGRNGNAGNASAVSKALSSANVETLRRTLGLNSATITDSNLGAKLDVTNSDQFLNFTKTKFNTMLSTIVTNFRGQQFRGQTNSSEIADFVRSKYTECYNRAVDNFKSDMESDGPTYKATLRAVEEQESGINAEIKSSIDDAQNQMNEFRTAFTKVYNSELPQFSQDCAASDDAYQSLDCLRMLSATLKSGIEGTNQTVKLDNALAGSGMKQFTAQAPGTVLTLQNITLDQAGKPTLGTTNTSCVGFNECVNVLERYRQSHVDQAQSQTQTRQKFVDENNKNVQSSLSAMGAQFSEVSKLFNTEIQNLNTAMAALGVNGSFKTKQVTGEALTKDEKTGLFEVPKDMKAAIASTGSITELDESEDGTTALNDQFNEITKKVNEALVLKNKTCILKKSDYDAIANALGSCEAEKVCKGNKVSGLLSSLERLMRKSQAAGSTDDKGTIGRDYASCMNSASSTYKSEARDAVRDARSSLGAGTSETLTSGERAEAIRQGEALKEQAKNDKSEAEKACGSTAMGDIDALAADSREALQGSNSKLAGSAKKLAEACPDDTEAAAAACKEVKKAANGASIPDEGETKLDASSSSSPTFTNPLSGTAK